MVRSFFQLRSAVLAAGCLCVSAYSAGAQGMPSDARSVPPTLLQQANGGTVSGRVICSDTQHPARFAQVTLISADPDSENRGSFGPRGGARTDLDGAFTINNVAPGDYYVSASATGYISEAALLTAAGADLATALSHLPTVHVSANSPSMVNVSIDRGGVIAGRVQWDDGSPATGVQLNVVSANPQATSTGGPGFGFGGFGGGGGFGQTDDRGQFRLTGLAPGDYYVRTTLQAPAPATQGGGGFNRNSAIVMYAPGKVRRADAQAITVHSGEERTDLVIVLDLQALHRVSGHVSGTSGTVASGTVRLTDSQDSSLTRMGAINADGSYLLPYVPAGTYTLSVSNASSVPQRQGRGNRNDGGSTTGTTFQPLKETLSVTDADLSDLNLTLVPVTQTSSQ